jgi:protein-S-isoprenylcysteine O-methyltransferase Ste14
LITKDLPKDSAPDVFTFWQARALLLPNWGGFCRTCGFGSVLWTTAEEERMMLEALAALDYMARTYRVIPLIF